jgi:hypothetical protein
MVITPCAPYTPANDKAGLLAADESIRPVDPVNYEGPLASAADGRFTLPVLIPGATYRITDRSINRDSAGPRLRKQFTVKLGELLDLGDVLIEKPQP